MTECSLTAYFRRNRRNQIKKYCSATLWVTRRDARDWALHYGRLLRKLGAKA